jgi:hypothetical protein
MTSQFSIEEFREKIALRRQEDSWHIVGFRSTIVFKHSLLTSDYYELMEQINRIKALNPKQTIPQEYNVALSEWKETFLIFFKKTLTKLDLKTRAVMERPLSYSKGHLQSLHEIISEISSVKFLNKYEEFFAEKQQLLYLDKIMQLQLINYKIQKIKQKFFFQWSHHKRIDIPQMKQITDQDQDHPFFQWLPLELLTAICEELSVRDLSNLTKVNQFLYNQLQNFQFHKCSKIQKIAFNQAEKNLETCQIDFPNFYNNLKKLNPTCVTIFENLFFVGLEDCTIKILQYDWHGNYRELQTFAADYLKVESLIVTQTKVYILTQNRIEILARMQDNTFEVREHSLQKNYPFSSASIKVIRDQIYIFHEGKIEIWKENSKERFTLFQTIDSHPNLVRLHFHIKGELLFTGSIEGIIEVYRCTSDGKFDWLQDLVPTNAPKITYLHLIGDLLISQDDKDVMHIWKQNRKGKFDFTQRLKCAGSIDSLVIKGRYCFIGAHTPHRTVLLLYELDPLGKLHLLQTVKNEEGIILDLKVIGSLLFTLSCDQSIQMWKQEGDGLFSERIQLSNSSHIIEHASLALENWHLFLFFRDVLSDIGGVKIFKLLDPSIPK